MDACNENLLDVVKEAQRLLDLADQGDTDRSDESCGVVYGVVRDAAYKMKEISEREIEKHRLKGIWDS